MNADRDTTQSSSASIAERENEQEGDSYRTPITPSGNYGEEEQGLLHGDHPNNVRLNTVRSTPSSTTTTRVSSYIRKKASDIFGRGNGEGSSGDAELKPKLASLVEAYRESDIAKGLREEREEMRRAAASSTGTGTPHGNGGNGAARTISSELPDVAVETQLLRGRKRASWGTQFRILSGRAFKNLYRDPALLTAHYVSSIALACECALLLLDFISVPMGDVLQCFVGSSLGTFRECPRLLCLIRTNVMMCQGRYLRISEPTGIILLHPCPIRFLLPVQSRPVR
jgi:hypothetical protein